MKRRALLLSCPAALAAAGGAGCAALPGREPARVSLVGLEPLPGQGLELRVAVRLRVQNPNDVALAYDGVSLELDVRGLAFASGVSDAAGSVPRFGEAVLTVPVTVSAVAMARQLWAATQGPERKLDYQLRGRLSGGPLGSARFSSSGQIDWPGSP